MDTKPKNIINFQEFKGLTKKQRCPICHKRFVNIPIHIKYHNPTFLKKYKERMRNENPAKRADVRIKISNAARNKIPWNKGKTWIKDKRHNNIVNEVAENLKREGYKVLTTYGYVPDAIIINFENKTVKCLEVNPGSIIKVEERAREKGYHSLIIKVDRNGKYSRKNIVREISSLNI